MNVVYYRYMFTRKPKWYASVLKVLLVAGVLYKVARLFMRSAEKLSRVKPASKRK